mmetsp:Transcript_19888/g.41857  ORF Transcript_19888/g.41857 Transcript_19888/m.41857 type:complete len:115 (+) Transcript_19888:1351-1695(+)
MVKGVKIRNTNTGGYRQLEGACTEVMKKESDDANVMRSVSGYEETWLENRLAGCESNLTAKMGKKKCAKMECTKPENGRSAQVRIGQFIFTPLLEPMYHFLVTIHKLSFFWEEM